MIFDKISNIVAETSNGSMNQKMDLTIQLHSKYTAPAFSFFQNNVVWYHKPVATKFRGKCRVHKAKCVYF